MGTSQVPIFNSVMNGFGDKERDKDQEMPKWIKFLKNSRDIDKHYEIVIMKTVLYNIDLSLCILG
jgi:hypothetical protein